MSKLGINPLTDMEAFHESVNDESKRFKRPESQHNNAGLTKMIQSEEQLKKAKSSDIVFAKPILLKEELPVIFPNSINVVQGKSGVHKSRLAEIITASFLKTAECGNQLLGFKRNAAEAPMVAYIDSERNISDQFPAALQSILRLSGYNKEEDPDNFRYSSLIKIERKERLGALKEYLEKLRETESNHLVVILDVLSDCVGDFNSSSETLGILDMLNEMINDWNVTFICVIHENPGKSIKARGHLGTEVGNKSTTVLQVSVDDGDKDLIKVAFLKCRSTRRHDDFFVTYCEDQHTLIEADESLVHNAKQERQRKAPSTDVRDTLKVILHNAGEMKKSDIIKSLMETFQAGDRTIRDRISELIHTKEEMVIKVDGEAKSVCLHEFKDGKNAMLKLGPIPSSEDEI